VTSDDGLHFKRVVGTLESIDSSSIVVRRDNGDSVDFPRGPSTRLDVSAGPGLCSEGRRGNCAVIGLFGGAGLGFLAGAVVIGGSNCGEECGLAYLFTVPLGALVGIVVGASVGGEH